jgi:DUF1016 N-terminal domain
MTCGAYKDDFIGEHLPRVAAEIHWGHNMVLIFKLKDPVQGLWYGHQATANNWSRSMLEHWIESGVYSRQGEAVTNFSNTLPPPQSDLAKEIVRDPYNFDFLTLREPISERELEEGAPRTRPQIPPRARRRFHLCGATGASRGGWRGLLHRSVALSPEAAMSLGLILCKAAARLSLNTHCAMSGAR